MIDSFTPEFGFLVRFGDSGSDGTETGTEVEELSTSASFVLDGVGDRGGVCSDGGKRFDDA